MFRDRETSASTSLLWFKDQVRGRPCSEFYPVMMANLNTQTIRREQILVIVDNEKLFRDSEARADGGLLY